MLRIARWARSETFPLHLESMLHASLSTNVCFELLVSRAARSCFGSVAKHFSLLGRLVPQKNAPNPGAAAESAAAESAAAESAA